MTIDTQNKPSLALQNMVEQQVRPWNVLNQNLLDVLLKVDRVDFVKADYQQLAYSDTMIPLGNGSMMLEPKVQARIIQELELTEESEVLIIGSGSGYIAALCASLCNSVTAYERDTELCQLAKQNLTKYSFTNIELFNHDASKVQWTKKFDCIVICGCVSACPESLIESLNLQGRLLYFLKKEGIGDVQLLKKTATNNFFEHAVFQATAPEIVGYETKQEFHL